MLLIWSGLILAHGLSSNHFFFQSSNICTLRMFFTNFFYNFFAQYFLSGAVEKEKTTSYWSQIVFFSLSHFKKKS
jgi:hypothetical protein